MARDIIAKATSGYQMLRKWNIGDRDTWVIVDICVCGKCKEPEEMFLSSPNVEVLFKAWVEIISDKKVLERVAKELRMLLCEAN